MFKNLLITGDCHGQFSKIKHLEYKPEETAIILLGDTGINFHKYKEWKDYNAKKGLNKMGYTLYIIRGNHDMRPQDVKGMKIIYDEYCQGLIYKEEKFPKINYLMDGGIYNFNGYKCLVVGGAYSVDKEFRLQNNWPWFENEQLTKKEFDDIINNVKGQYFDFVLTHTCPIEWEPTDLFLSFIDQKTVDKTSELKLSELKNSITFGVWCFGHYHQDRMERPYAEMFFHDIEFLEDINYKWNAYRDGNKSAIWYGEKSPNFYMGVEKNENC